MKKRYLLIWGIVGAVVFYEVWGYSIIFPPLFWTLEHVVQIPLMISQNLWAWFFNTFLSWMDKDPNLYFNTAQYIHLWFNRISILLVGFVLGIIIGYIYGKIEVRAKNNLLHAQP
jgi:uncharacterized membrane protein